MTRKSQAFCIHCGTAFLDNYKGLGLLIQGDKAQCNTCGKSSNIEQTLIKPLSNHGYLMNNPDAVRNTYWLHIDTKAPDEVIFHNANPTVQQLQWRAESKKTVTHAGQLKTVKDYNEWEYCTNNREFWCYKLTIIPEARICPETVNDMNDWDDIQNSIYNGTSQYDIYPYLNRWEGCGSVSLIGNPMFFDVVKTRHRQFINSGMDKKM